MEIILLTIIVFLIIFNIFLLFFLGLFVVRMNDRISSMLGELAEIILSDNSIAPLVTNKNEEKSWDQKYEEALDSFAMRMKVDSGLIDPEVGNSYNAPPALDPRNADGLTIKNR